MEKIFFLCVKCKLKSFSILQFPTAMIAGRTSKRLRAFKPAMICELLSGS